MELSKSIKPVKGGNMIAKPAVMPKDYKSPPAPKPVTVKQPVKSTPKPLVGAAAVKEYQRQVSGTGMAVAEARARAAINNRYGNKSTSGNSVAKLVSKVKRLGK